MGGEYPLSPSQRESISCFQEIREGELLAVNGPPGTGKTTLLQSVVADMYVKTAIEREKAPIIVATSTNNQAVTNIIESFGKINSIGIRNLEQRWITGVHSFAVYFPSKSKEAEAQKNNYQYTNVKGEGFVEEVESEDNRKNSQEVFDKEFSEYFGYKYNSLREAIERIHSELLSVDKQRILCIKSMTELKGVLGNKSVAKYLADLSSQIEKFENEIHLFKEEEDRYSQKEKQLTERCNSWRKSYEQLPWYIRLFKFLPCFRKKIETWTYKYMDFNELKFLRQDMNIDEIEKIYHEKISENGKDIRDMQQNRERHGLLVSFIDVSITHADKYIGRVWKSQYTFGIISLSKGGLYMEKKKLHVLDWVLLVGIALIAIVSALIDIFYVVVFPVCSCVSVYYVSYPLLIILLIYSSVKYKEKEEQDKPKLVKWYMLLLLPVLHIAFIIVGFIIGIGLKNIFHL